MSLSYLRSKTVFYNMRDNYLITTQSYGRGTDGKSELPTQYGYLIKTDLNKILRKLAIPTSTESLASERIKPGIRGVCLFGKKIITTSWNKIFIINYERFEIEDSFSHPLMGDLHGIHADETGVWVNSSLTDSLLWFDWDKVLRGYLTFSNTALYNNKQRKYLDFSIDYRKRGKEFRGFRAFHNNHVVGYDREHILVTGRGKGHKKGKVLLVDKRFLKYRIWADGLFGPHDGIFLEDGRFAVTETNTASVALIGEKNLFGKRRMERLFLPKNEAKFWTRGLCLDSDGNFLIGKSVWAGEDNKASVVTMTTGGKIVNELFLDIEDYPECRIFQIVKAPY